MPTLLKQRLQGREQRTQLALGTSPATHRFRVDGRRHLNDAGGADRLIVSWASDLTQFSPHHSTIRRATFGMSVTVASYGTSSTEAGRTFRQCSISR